MRTRHLLIVSATAAVLLVLSACSGPGGESALYVLEELESASAVEDPQARLERLGIFVQNHPDHLLRIEGHTRAFKTLAVDIKDREGAVRYLDGVLDSEADPRVRGMLQYQKFAHFWSADSELAVSIVSDLLGSDERYSRLFLYLGYYLTGGKDLGALAERCFARAIDLAESPFQRHQAEAALGTVLDMMGRSAEAEQVLQQASSYPLANRRLGRLLWDRGDRTGAVRAYIRLVAGVPGARGDVGLDSLFALVHPDRDDLEEQIAEQRVIDEGPLPDRGFVDIEGKRYNLSAYRGKFLVLSIWSPT